MSIPLSKYFLPGWVITSANAESEVWKAGWPDTLSFCSLNPAMSQKFGFSSVEEFMEQSQKKFSLVETGIVHKPSARLLLINVRRSLKPNEGIH